MSKKGNGGQRSRAAQNFGANQRNPNKRAFGAVENNRANQFNPKNAAIPRSRGNAKSAKK